MISAILGLIGGPIAKIIDKSVKDKDLAEKIKSDLTLAAMTNEADITKAAAGIIQAEAQSEHPLTAQWRPILMLSITAILVNNFLIAPYFQAMFGVSVTLDLPEPMWNLLTVGVGGYVMGRSAEKAVRHWRGNGDSGNPS